MLVKFHSKNKSRGSSGGYLLIEAMVAITMVVVGLLGIFSLLSQSLSLNRIIGDRYVASYLASEGIEVIKNIIDNNVLASDSWNKGLNKGNYQFDYRTTSLGAACGSSCAQSFNFDSVQKIYSYLPSGKPTNFVRVISVEPIADKDGLIQSLKINSKVKWLTRGSGQFSVNLEDHFYNYR